MIEVYRGSDYFEAQLLKGLMEQDGYRCFCMVLPCRVGWGKFPHWDTFRLQSMTPMLI